MGAENMLQLVLDADTNVLTAVYTPPPRPEPTEAASAPAAAPASQEDGEQPDDQDTSVATEAAFIDGRSNEVVAEVVRKGAGTDLENSSQVMQAKDARVVLDGWARDMVNAFQALKK